MLVAGGMVVVLIFLIGLLQTLGETRLTYIFPVISVLAVLFFLARCMFTAPVHH